MTGIGNGPKIVFEIGGLRFTETVVMGWLIIVAVLILCLWLTHDLKKVPEKKRQVGGDACELRQQHGQREHGR